VNPVYAAWVAEHVPDYPAAYGKCLEVTLAMLEAFPELRRVRGHYQCPLWGERSHWWLVDQDGTVVDPTVRQFPSHGIGEYVPWVDGDPEPTGKCPECGEPVYNGATFCCKSHAQSYMAYIMTGVL
jgi:hypothetical protein